MDTATKTGIDTAKTASKQVVQKTAEATRDLIRNKIAHKITSLSKTKSKEKEGERQEIYMPPEKLGSSSICHRSWSQRVLFQINLVLFVEPRFQQHLCKKKP